MTEKIRCRNWCMVLYPEDETHAACMTALNRGYKYVAILHDSDKWEEGESNSHEAGEAKKAHWHVILKFPQARWQEAVAKELGIPANYLEPCRSYEASALYLLHIGYPGKHEYDPESLFGPLTPSVLKLLETDVDQNQRVRNLLELIKTQEKVLDMWDLIELACDNGMYGDLIRMGSLARDLLEIHNRRVLTAEDAEVAELGRQYFADMWPPGRL